MVALLEMAHGIATATEKQHAAVIARLQVLPIDLLANVRQASKALDEPIPNLRTGKVTVKQMAQLIGWIEAAERQGAERLSQLVNHLSPLAEADADGIVAWATEMRDIPATNAATPWLSELDDLEAERVMALVELHGIGVVDNETLAAYLVDVCGSKSKALATGKKMAARHDLPNVASTAEIAQDRMLTALVVRAQ